MSLTPHRAPLKCRGRGRGSRQKVIKNERTTVKRTNQQKGKSKETTERKQTRQQLEYKRLTFTEARMQLNFCGRILCILLPEAKKGSMAGCSAKRGSRTKTEDTCVLGSKAASGLNLAIVIRPKPVDAIQSHNPAQRFPTRVIFEKFGEAMAIGVFD